MKCPVCGQDCVQEAHEIIDILPDIFQPCSSCMGRGLDKNKPLSDLTFGDPCLCGKRFIDDVYAHMYAIMVQEGILKNTDPLKAVGIPLVHPGFAMSEPPFLPENSLVLISKSVTKPVAERLVDEVPEIRGVIRGYELVPGISDIDFDGIPDTYDLLAGCDVRANVFSTQNKPLVIYKQQSVMHIEFPRGYDPKIISVGVHVRQVNPEIFVDAACGAGTLGLVAALYKIPRVIFNDAWYAAAFWTAYNLKVNRENLGFDDVKIFFSNEEMKKEPVVKEPKLIAKTSGGDQYCEVYQGDYRLLHTILPEHVDLTVLDLFEKNIPEKMKKEIEDWQKFVSGEVFIP